MNERRVWKALLTGVLVAGLSVSTTVYAGEWKSNQNGWLWYEEEDGSYPANCQKEIEGDTYSFTQYGYMETGWKYRDGLWYYFGEDGKMCKNFWKWIENSCYYFYEDGHMASDEMIDESYVNKAGAWVPNSWVADNYGWWYRYGNGNYPKSQMTAIDSKTYLFDEYGYMKTGWHYNEGKWYYFDDAMIQNCWKWIGDFCYYFYEDGHMASDERIESFYVNASGEWSYDTWVYSNYAYKYWYHYEDGSYPCNEFCTIDGKVYSFDQDGYMQTGWIYKEGKWYYFNASGAMEIGWYQVNGYWYYSNEEGVMQTGTIIVDGQEYYLNPSGEMAEGWLYQYDYWLYFDPSGHQVKNEWKWIDGEWYHFNEDGIMQKGWLLLGDDWYYLKSSGAMQRGWARISSKHYHFNGSGVMDKEQDNPSTLITPQAGYYISPMLADSLNTRYERIEAMISTAYTYLGTTFRPCHADAPGTLVDCSGLAMQGLYAAGYDPAPISPWRHALPEYEYESRNMWNLPMRQVSGSELERGDLVFYNGPNGIINHVAIYIGDGNVIEAWPPRVVVQPMINWQHGNLRGFLRPFE